MKGTDTTNTGPRRLQLDEAKICQLITVLEKMWPDEIGAIPSESNNVGRVEASNLCVGKTNNPAPTSDKTIRFPRARKRGAKVRIGPCADIIRFRCGRSDFSKNERSLFDSLSKTKGARYAIAVIEHFRLPFDEGSRFCRQGMTPAEFLHKLNCGVIRP